MEIENFLEKVPLAENEEMEGRMSPLLHSCPNERENFPEHAESSKRNEGTVEIMEMLVLIRKEMEEREKKWERQQHIREEFLEADFKRREQQWEQNLRQKEEELDIKEKEWLGKMKASLEAFYND